MVLVVPQGKHAVRLGTNASIRQKVAAQTGKFYALTFSFARTCSQEEVLNVTITPSSKGHSGILPLQTVYSSVGFDSYAWGFRAEANVIEISLHNPGQPGEDHACGPLIDTIALTILDSVKPTGGTITFNFVTYVSRLFQYICTPFVSKYINVLQNSFIHIVV